MRYSIASTLLLTQALVSQALPDRRLSKMNAIDWERELLGEEAVVERAANARSEKSLDAIFKSLGKQYFGTCADASLLNNAQNADVLKADFGQLTPENRYILWNSGEENTDKFVQW